MGLFLSQLVGFGLLRAPEAEKPLPKQFWWDDVPTPAATSHGGAP